MLTEDDVDHIIKKCTQFQGEMARWLAGADKRSVKFDGTVASLIRSYRTDPDSPFHALRYASVRHYKFFTDLIEKDHGTEKLASLGARDFRRWHALWTGDGKVALAHAAMTCLRLVLKFGNSYEIEKEAGLPGNECARLRGILRDMEFPNAPARTATLTRDHCNAIRLQAHAQKLPSVALAQALQFELTLRQKDVIGEWVPIAEPGISDVMHAGMKWVRGLRWEEIGPDMVLRHQMSKARKVKILEFDLNFYPMVMEEIARIPLDQRAGPVIVSEINGRPWKQPGFRQKWRDVADAAEVPANIRNMDSRAGGTTETIDVTDGNLEAARKQAGHADVRTTQRYSRGNLESNSKVAVLRSGAASKTKQEP